jgi:hypothetical protein
VDSKDHAHEASDGNGGSTGILSRVHAYYILAKNLFAFCPCSKTSEEAEFRGDGLINVVEEVLRQSAIRLSHGYSQLLLTRFLVRIGSKNLSRKTGKTWSDKPL